jgi:hypothetical protein
MAPWTAGEAKAHTKKAKGKDKAKKWASVANAVLKRTGSDASAIRIANAVVKKRGKKSGKKKP